MIALRCTLGNQAHERGQCGCLCVLCARIYQGLACHSAIFAQAAAAQLVAGWSRPQRDHADRREAEDSECLRVRQP